MLWSICDFAKMLKHLIKPTAPQQMWSMWWCKTNAPMHIASDDILCILTNTEVIDKEGLLSFQSYIVGDKINYSGTWSLSAYNTQTVQTAKMQTLNNRLVLLCTKQVALSWESGYGLIACEHDHQSESYNFFLICVNWSVSLEYTKNHAMDQNTVLEGQRLSISHCQPIFTAP